MDNTENTDKSTKDAGEKLKKLLNGHDSCFPVCLSANYPQIVEKICAYWQEPVMMHSYFNELLTSQREKREGFLPDIHHEIFKLSDYYSAIHPKVIPTDDFWRGLDGG